jgi:uncharacterized protein
MTKRGMAIAALTALMLSGVAPAARADLSMFDTYFDNPARAAAANDAEGVRKLVGGGDGNPNQTDDQARTALHYAAANGNLQIIAILIKAQAHLNPTDPLGNTPLHLAALQGQTAAAELLVDAGAEIDPQNRDGMTPLMIAAQHGNLELVRALLAKGANPAKTDYTGRDAASWAQDNHHPAVVEAISRAAAKGS